MKIDKWLDGELFALNMERFGEQQTIWKFTNDWMTSLSMNDKSIAIIVERFGDQRTIWKFTNDWMISQLHCLLKDFMNNAMFQSSEMIGWQVNCDECGKIWRKTHTLKIHIWLDDQSIAIIVEILASNTQFQNSHMISQLQLMWKDLANNAQFENSQIIVWQVI